MENLPIVDLLYHIKLTDKQITELFEETLGISLTRYYLLENLIELAPCRQQDLQEKLAIDQAAITRHLKILEKSGYVLRERNPENQREVLVKPSPKAIQDLLQAPRPQHVAIKHEMEEILLPNEKQELKKLLTKLTQGLQHLHF